MINPVQRQAHVAQAQDLAPIAAAPASAAPSPPQGYFARIVLAIRDLVVSIFDKIYSFFTCGKPKVPTPPIDDREPPLLRPIPGLPPPEPVAEPPQDYVQRLHTMQGHELLAAFTTRFPNPLEQSGIYAAIGKTAGMWERWGRTPEEIGRARVLENSQLLMPFMAS